MIAAAFFDNFFTPGTVSFIATLVGAGVSMATCMLMMRHLDRARTSRGDQVPVSSRLLRPAGYTVGNELEAHTESMVSRLLLFIGAGAMAAMSGTSCFQMGAIVLRTTPDWGEVLQTVVDQFLWIFALLLIASLSAWVWLSVWIWRALKRQSELRLGYRGETAVGEALNHRKVMNAAIAIFHDVPGDGAWNVDHVVVTRAGVFLIETKTRTKRPGRHSLEADSVDCLGEVIRFPYWNDEQTVIQTDRNARWLRQFLNRLGLSDYPIHAVIALPGWNVRNAEKLRIPAMNANGVVKHIATTVAGATTLVDEARLKSLVDALDERCRTVEF